MTQACMDDLGATGTAALGATNFDERKATLLTFHEIRNRYPGRWGLMFTETRFSRPGKYLMQANGIKTTTTTTTFFFP